MIQNNEQNHIQLNLSASSDYPYSDPSSKSNNFFLEERSISGQLFVGTNIEDIQSVVSQKSDLKNSEELQSESCMDNSA